MLLFVSQNRYSQHMDDEQQQITRWENLGSEAVCDERMKAGESWVIWRDDDLITPDKLCWINIQQVRSQHGNMTFSLLWGGETLNKLDPGSLQLMIAFELLTLVGFSRVENIVDSNLLSYECWSDLEHCWYCSLHWVGIFWVSHHCHLTQQLLEIVNIGSLFSEKLWSWPSDSWQSWDSSIRCDWSCQERGKLFLQSFHFPLLHASFSFKKKYENNSFGFHHLLKQHSLHYLWSVTVEGTRAATRSPRGKMVRKAEEAASKGPPLPNRLEKEELLTLSWWQ